VEQFKQTMTKAGYKPLATRNSPEDEELLKFDAHLDPFSKEEGIMVEAHLNILGLKGDHSVANPEVWQEEEGTKSDGMEVSHLGKEHFIIYSLLHYSKHLSGEGFTEIKWLIDLLYAIRAWMIDWSKVKDISRKWSVEKDVLPVMATLNQYWQTQIPLPIASKPIALNILVQGIENRQKEYYAKLPASYLERFMKLRELPNKTSQVRYLFHLLFPTPKNLRWRYNLSSKKMVLPYYFLHHFFTLRKFLKGLFHQLSYHPKTTQ
jgi:hypothetical protein